MTREKEFSISIRFRDTNETFVVNGVTVNMVINKLKVRLELIAGIPKNLQRLMYLDEGDMEDNSTLQHHDIVSGAMITLTIWRAWTQLIQACVKGDIVQVMKLGVTVDSNYQDPNSNFMTPEKRKQYFLERQSIALFVAAHRGHIDIVKALLTSGGDINSTTKCGRTVLHVAAAAGQEACIALLLSKGAGHLIKVEDNYGKTPLQTAADYAHKASERRLFLFQWQVRASTMKTHHTLTARDLMAHQMHDSSLKTWLVGSYDQMYNSTILPPQQYEATTLEAKPSKHYYKFREGWKVPNKTCLHSSSKTAKKSSPNPRPFR